MEPMDKLVLEIDPAATDILVKSTKEDGSISTKRIGYEALVDCVKNSLKTGLTRSGLLPDGCISYDAGEGGWRCVSIVHPERYADITYQTTVYPHFPLPRLVFRFSLHMGLRVQSCQMGVVPEGRLTPDTPMFHYPFSNVNGFSLCIGGNVLPECKSLHTLTSLPYVILEMPNNDDHFSSSRNKLRLDHRNLLGHLQDKDPSYYYSDVLVSNGKTLKDFISQN